MKRTIALILALMLVCTCAFASEAPAVPQEAQTPLEMLFGSLFGGSGGEAPAAPAEEVPADVPEAPAEQRPAIEVTGFKAMPNGVLEIKFVNNLDVNVKSFYYVFMTYNDDGTLSRIAKSESYSESYKESFNVIWEETKLLKSGKSRTAEYYYGYNTGVNGAEYVELDTKHHDILAVGVFSYVLEDGTECKLASQQVVFRTTDGTVIPAAAASLEPQMFPEDRLDDIGPIALGMVKHDLPSYACEFYGMPAGQYVERVLAGSIAKDAGIMPGDVIMAYNDMSASMPHADKYCRLWLLESGSATVTYWRNGEIFTALFGG